MKKVEANGRTCNLGIWDTAGQERFDSPSSFYLLYFRWLYLLLWLYLLWLYLPGALRQPLELLLPRRARRHHLL